MSYIHVHTCACAIYLLGDDASKLFHIFHTNCVILNPCVSDNQFNVPSVV